jgi:hypothetical protein
MAPPDNCDAVLSTFRRVYPQEGKPPRPLRDERWIQHDIRVSFVYDRRAVQALVVQLRVYASTVSSEARQKAFACADALDAIFQASRGAFISLPPSDGLLFLGRLEAAESLISDLIALLCPPVPAGMP